MRSTRLLLLVAGLAGWAMLPQPSSAASLTVDASIAKPAPLVIPVLHGRRATSLYCYQRNYWWFYRPYTTAAENFPRCMPYFHYPAEAYRGRQVPPSAIK
jgi:hypothetical protein